MKLALSFFAMVLVFIQGQYRISNRDILLLKIIFILFFCAETVFFINNAMVGIIVFTAAQVILIIRNSTDIKSYVKSGLLKQNLRKWILIAVGILLINAIVLLIIYMRFDNNSLFPLVAVYSLILCCSVGAGFASRAIHFFPAKNINMITIGIILFYLGDITVGLNIIIDGGVRPIEYICSTSLTWLFYLPSISLIALSGFRWERNVLQ
jgi:hypothetical protein